jgi:hypothetical protein
MMFSRKMCIACLLFGMLLLIVGCGGAAPAAPWTLAWAASDSAAQSNAPEAAYAACARAQIPNGAVVTPATSTWLATGSQPSIGLALSQLDAAGRLFGVGVITIDPGSNRWQLTESGSLERPADGNGAPAAQEAGHAWHLPAGRYNSIALEVPDTPPGGSVQFWLSDNQQEFVLARFYSTIQPPAVSTSVTLAGQSGWLAAQGRFTIVGLRLTSGIYAGLGTLLFAGTTGTQQSEQLAAQAASDLNDILPA